MDFTVENAGTTIACREYAGPDVSPDAPALVCVHGACVDGTFFDGIACELSRNYRVIAYDRRGCGDSSDAADDSYDLAAQAADLQAVIEHVGAPAFLGSSRRLGPRGSWDDRGRSQACPTQWSLLYGQ